MQKEQVTSVASTKEARVKQAHRETLVARLGALAVAFIIGALYFLLPPYLRIAPEWLLLLVEALLLLPVIVSWLLHRPLPHLSARILIMVALVVLTAALIVGVALMISTLSLHLENGMLL